MVHQPDPEKAPDMASGLRSVRKLHMEALEEFHMPAADEMLYPETGHIWKIFYLMLPLELVL